MLQNFGRGALSDFVQDWVIYRNLEPLDKRLPGLKSAFYRMGLPDEHIPRKQEPGYAKAAIWFIEQGMQLHSGRKRVEEMLFIGDTLFHDGRAFRNIQAASGWKSSCFIGADRPEQEPIVTIDEANLYNANRWSELANWLSWAREQGFHLDGRTAVVVDIDKTALGAKGRNDQVIDRARLEGIFRTMTDVLGESNFDKNLFVQHYGELNRARYHFLTADNQDYLVYICLVLNAGLVSFDELLGEIQQNSLENFEQFIRWVDSRMMLNDTGIQTLTEVHEAVLASVRSGDPTPFKRFRRQEFVCTALNMGNLADTSSVQELLNGEIVVTEEVYQVATWLGQRGCFVLCLSDKPAEASRPTGRGTQDTVPIHRVTTHRIGNDIREVLAGIR